MMAKEYNEMWELLPESWRLEAALQGGQGSCFHSKCPKRDMITDYTVWAECYSIMAAVLAAAYPDKAPHTFT